MTTEEYFKEVDKLKEYSEISQIEFTGYSVSAMKSLNVYFTLNNVVRAEVTLNTKNENDEWVYWVEQIFKNKCRLEEKETPTKQNFDNSRIIYYEGGIE